MVSKAKLYSKLDSLEAELQGRLIPHLQHAANGKNDLVFCAAGFNYPTERKYKTDGLTNELVDLGSQILSLKRKLDQPSEGSIAERICWYCREWGKGKSSHEHRAQDLALQFLQEIESGGKNAN
jgi:hypothetical protein